MVTLYPLQKVKGTLVPIVPLYHDGCQSTV